MKLVKREDHWSLYNEDGHKIAATIPGCNSKLSIKNCEAIENGYDLDELAEEEAKKRHDWNKHRDTDIYNELVREDAKLIKIGLQKALEILGDKKFSKEDVISMIEESRKTGLTAEYLILTKQQTEFDVEIEWEKDTELFNVCPKLDDNGCLILKID